MKKIRIILIAVLLAAVPVASYLLEFRLGTKCLPYGYSMAYAIFFILFAPILLAIVTAFLVPARIVYKALVGLGVLIVTPLLAFFAVSPGAVIYSQGFEHAVRKDPGIPELQRWAESALHNFREGGAVSTNAPSYWNPGDVMLPPESLPPFLKTGTFASLGVPNFGPEISVCTNGGRLGIGGECIAISWYLHGLLVGPPQFKNDWNPWYCKELAPGVYSYHGMK